MMITVTFCSFNGLHLIISAKIFKGNHMFTTFSPKTKVFPTQLLLPQAPLPSLGPQCGTYHGETQSQRHVTPNKRTMVIFKALFPLAWKTCFTSLSFHLLIHKFEIIIIALTRSS